MLTTRPKLSCSRARTTGFPSIGIRMAGLSVTISLGAVATDKGKEISGRSLIQAVDDALYRAKGAGRNRLELGKLNGADSHAV